MSTYPESPNSSPQCPHCGDSRTVRVKRKGFMQTVVLHRFGIFPWECTGCRKTFTCKNRGKVRRRRKANSKGIVKLPPSLNGTISQEFDYSR